MPGADRPGMGILACTAYVKKTAVGVGAYIFIKVIANGYVVVCEHLSPSAVGSSPGARLRLRLELRQRDWHCGGEQNGGTEGGSVT